MIPSDYRRWFIHGLLAALGLMLGAVRWFRWLHRPHVCDAGREMDIWIRTGKQPRGCCLRRWLEAEVARIYVLRQRQRILGTAERAHVELGIKDGNA